jgi:predicted NUDIX family NTP pyrophosphohydrolase
MKKLIKKYNINGADNLKTLSRQHIFNGKIIKVYKDEVELSNGIFKSNLYTIHWNIREYKCDNNSGQK